VGAVPGALPPVLGWTAAGGELGASAFSLFAILFLWHFPHFLAIAWMYRDQYRQAGLKMVPGGERAGVIGVIATVYALSLIPVSLLPLHWGLCGDLYGILAAALGLIYAGTAAWFQRDQTRGRARRLLWVSLIYLPTLFMALTLDHLRLLR
jgi:protoheme IX farnesyltransferase